MIAGRHHCVHIEPESPRLYEAPQGKYLSRGLCALKAGLFIFKFPPQSFYSWPNYPASEVCCSAICRNTNYFQVYPNLCSAHVILVNSADLSFQPKILQEFAPPTVWQELFTQVIGLQFVPYTLPKELWQVTLKPLWKKDQMVLVLRLACSMSV